MVKEQMALLMHLFPSLTKGGINKWRVNFSKQHKDASLWSLVSALANVESDLPKKKKGDDGKNDEENNSWRLHHDEFAEEEFGITGAECAYIEKRLAATRAQKTHEAALDRIIAIEEGGVDCGVCCDSFRVEDSIHCEGSEMHWLCKPCFRQYATVTVEAGDHTSITCCVPQCGAIFTTDAAVSGLGDLDLLKMAERETARNQKVALAAKAVLRCACGTVGVVMEEDMSADGRITCPGCSRSYCAKCGNDAHPGKDCPPPAKTLEWMKKHGKPCPNCGDLIQKNGGCQHMHCAPPGGCGHHFCWGCLRPYPQQCHGCGRGDHLGDG